VASAGCGESHIGQRETSNWQGRPGVVLPSDFSKEAENSGGLHEIVQFLHLQLFLF
jgi:hypothetical protein